MLADRKAAFSWRCLVQRDLGQLDAANRSMNVGHPHVEADDLILVLPHHSLVAVEAYQ